MSGISRRFFGVMACAALGCLIGGAPVRGEDAPAAGATGSITGTVTADGKPVAGASVRVMPPRRHPGGGEGGPGGAGGKGGPPPAAPNEAPAGGQGGPGDQGGPGQGGPGGPGQGGPGGPGGRPRPKPIAETTTAADGTFTVANIPVGDYEVVAGLRGTGMGHVKVTVTAGAAAKADITLQKRPGGHGGQGGPGGGQGGPGSQGGPGDQGGQGGQGGGGQGQHKGPPPGNDN